jgi:hypothetical protein
LLLLYRQTFASRLFTKSHLAMNWLWKPSLVETAEPSSMSLSQPAQNVHGEPQLPPSRSPAGQSTDGAAMPKAQPDDIPESSDFDAETRAPAKAGHSIAPLQDSMNCRQSFDEAMYCSFLGSHFNNIYRYGELRECSDKWSDFWFCARMRSYPQAEKEQAIRDRFRTREEEKYIAGPSSEDVWESRKQPVDRAFHMDPDAESLFDYTRKPAA